MRGGRALSRKLGDHARTAESLCNLSRATRELGDYGERAALAQEALVLHRAARHRGGTADALLVLGDVARDLGEPGRGATSGARKVWPFSESWATRSVKGSPCTTSPSRPTGEGDLDLARSLCEESLAIFRRLDVGGATAEVLASLGPILDAVGEPASAFARADRGVTAGLASRTALGGCGQSWRASPGWPPVKGRIWWPSSWPAGRRALRSAIGCLCGRTGSRSRADAGQRTAPGSAKRRSPWPGRAARSGQFPTSLPPRWRCASPRLRGSREPRPSRQGDLSTGLSTRERDVFALAGGRQDRSRHRRGALHQSPHRLQACRRHPG